MGGVVPAPRRGRNSSKPGASARSLAVARRRRGRRSLGRRAAPACRPRGSCARPPRLAGVPGSRRAALARGMARPGRAERGIRLALREADVNFKVVKDFVAQVRERALGADVTKSLTPGQQVVKIVHEELTALMGAGSSKLAFGGRPPTVILLAGLQGSGKTTAAAKLALLLRKEKRKPGP